MFSQVDTEKCAVLINHCLTESDDQTSFNRRGRPRVCVPVWYVGRKKELAEDSLPASNLSLFLLDPFLHNLDRFLTSSFVSHWHWSRASFRLHWNCPSGHRMMKVCWQRCPDHRCQSFLSLAKSLWQAWRLLRLFVSRPLLRVLLLPSFSPPLQLLASPRLFVFLMPRLQRLRYLGWLPARRSRGLIDGCVRFATGFVSRYSAGLRQPTQCCSQSSSWGQHATDRGIVA